MWKRHQKMMSDEFCRNELKRIHRDWQNGEEIIQWTVIVSYGKVFQYICKILLCCLFFSLAYYVIQNFDKINKVISILLLFFIFNLFIIIFDTVSNYYIEKVKINRKKQWIYISGIAAFGAAYYSKPFHATGRFAPFRLPENDTGEYAQLREKLQSAITRETGIAFFK